MIFQCTQSGKLQIHKEQERAVFDTDGYETQNEANEAIRTEMEAVAARLRAMASRFAGHHQTKEYYIIPVSRYVITVYP